jgi:hypothetical protein
VDIKGGLDDVEKRKFLTLSGIEHRPLGRPARSHSPYRLSYPGSLYNVDDRMINEYGAVYGMRIGRGNRNTRIKPVPVQIPCDMGSNPCHRSGKPVSSRLSYLTALMTKSVLKLANIEKGL